MKLELVYAWTANKQGNRNAKESSGRQSWDRLGGRLKRNVPDGLAIDVASDHSEQLDSTEILRVPEDPRRYA